MNLPSLSIILLGTLAAAAPVTAAERLLKPRDVVAFVGGEDMVAATETAQLEVRLIRAFPDFDLKFRGLAWEGDTVFEQLRELNYPSLEQQLDDSGATVVIAQFGQMESLAGPGKLAEFSVAYEKLIARLRGGDKRRVIVQPPTRPAPTAPGAAHFGAYDAAIRALVLKQPAVALLADGPVRLMAADYRDGIHLNERGHAAVAAQFAPGLGAGADPMAGKEAARLLDLVRAKNRLWFNYARPQNWAFLNGDRTVQPSSRDHIDPEKRWFPEEMKLWLPLIAAKEQEIQAVARQVKNRD